MPYFEKHIRRVISIVYSIRLNNEPCAVGGRRTHGRADAHTCRCLSEAETVELSVKRATAQAEQRSCGFLVAGRLTEHTRDVVALRVGEQVRIAFFAIGRCE